MSTFQNFKISKLQHFKLSKFQNFKDLKISKFQTFNISNFQNFKISNFQNFNISKFKKFNISKFQHFNISKFSKCQPGNRDAWLPGCLVAYPLASPASRPAASAIRLHHCQPFGSLFCSRPRCPFYHNPRKTCLGHLAEEAAHTSACCHQTSDCKRHVEHGSCGPSP